MGAGYCHTCGILGAPKYWRDVTGCREQKHNVTERSDTMSGQGKHTPGPWKVASPAYGTLDIMGEHAVCRLYTERAINTDGPTFYEAEDNARLIAAAPEMMETLHLIADAADRCANGGLDFPNRKATAADFKVQMRDIRDHARTIIRKATGSQV